MTDMPLGAYMMKIFFFSRSTAFVRRMAREKTRSTRWARTQCYAELLRRRQRQ
jgi:hypothetical protein